jgi:hypothetical protein
MNRQIQPGIKLDGRIGVEGDLYLMAAPARCERVTPRITPFPVGAL